MTPFRITALLVCLLLIPCQVLTQVDTSVSRIDTAGIQQAAPGKKAPDALTPGFQPKKSSLLAVGLSLVLPGAGQIYNEDYWKAPVLWLLGGYWVYEHGKNNKTFSDFSYRYFTSITPTNAEGDPQLKTLRDFYRDERDKFAWYLGGLYALNLLDAYVGANLYDFTVTPDLSLDGRLGTRVAATFRLKF